VSDIHFDLRSEFAAAGLDAFIDSYVLSFEHGVQKPDEQIFRIAADTLALHPEDLLMVGDRASHDGGAVACGITTLLLPPLHTADRRKLDVVLGVLDGANA
jgi:FMN phosphatase YigB (HAD superfamily)